MVEKNLSAIQAMSQILEYDGFRYEIRRDGGRYSLYHSAHPGNSTLSDRYMCRTVVFSLSDSLYVASVEIAKKVIELSDYSWNMRIAAMPDDDWKDFEEEECSE